MYHHLMLGAVSGNSCQLLWKLVTCSTFDRLGILLLCRHLQDPGMMRTAEVAAAAVLQTARAAPMPMRSEQLIPPDADLLLGAACVRHAAKVSRTI